MAEQSLPTKVDLLEQSYNAALRVSEPERKEQKKMHNYYTGFNKGQWSIEGKSLLQSRGSMVPQVNLIKPKIRKLAGSAVRNFFDVSFTPVNTLETPLTRKANDVFVADSNMMKYDLSYFDCVVDALTHIGVQQMKLTTRFSPLGNITFETLLPGHVIIDPNWKTKDSWDISEVWKVAYLTPNEIDATYGRRNARIKELIAEIKMNGLQYDIGEDDPSMAYHNQNSSYGSKYRVIEHHFLEVTSKVLKFARVSEGEDIDITNSDPAQIETIRNDPESNVTSIIERRVFTKVYKIQSSCKELDQFKLLEDGVSDIQIGRLPFFPLSADRQGGRNSGIVEALADVQVLLNSREARVDDQIAASGGALAIDPMIVGGDDAKAREIMAHLDRPDGKFLTQTGMLASGRNLIQEIKKPAYAGDLFQDIQRLAGYMDQLSGQTATLDGMKESAHDTGVLFTRRAVQAEIAMTHLTQSLERFRRDEAEAWLLYAKHVYSGPFREFVKDNKEKGTKEIVTLNIREYDEEGNVFVNDDLSKMPRHNVIISQSKDGLTTREVDRSRNVELMNYVTGPIKRAILEQNALETLDNSVEDKAELRKYGDLELAVVVATQEAQLAGMKLQTATAEQQLSQMQMQTQQMAAGGMPQEGGEGGAQPEGGQQPQEGAPAQVPQQTAETVQAQ